MADEDSWKIVLFLTCNYGVDIDSNDDKPFWSYLLTPPPAVPVIMAVDAKRFKVST